MEEEKPQATLLTGAAKGLLEDSCPGSWMGPGVTNQKEALDYTGPQDHPKPAAGG